MISKKVLGMVPFLLAAALLGFSIFGGYQHFSTRIAMTLMISSEIIT